MSKFHLLSALLAAALVAPATAEDGAEAASVVVQTGDLDLTNPAHQRRLNRRVQAAIGVICGSPGRDLTAAQDAIACRRLARAKADTQVRFAIVQAKLSKARLAGKFKAPVA